MAARAFVVADSLDDEVGAYSAMGDAGPLDWLLVENRDEKVLLRADIVDGGEGKGELPSTATYSSRNIAAAENGK
jgi:hypothetical protein